MGIFAVPGESDVLNFPAHSTNLLLLFLSVYTIVTAVFRYCPAANTQALYFWIYLVEEG